MSEGRVETAARFLRERLGGGRFDGAIVLGSGLGVLLERWAISAEAWQHEVPGFPQPSVAGHEGLIAAIGDSRCRWLAFRGRVHFYEGRTRDDVTFAVRVAAALGAGRLLLTNAAGSVDAHLRPGTAVVITDHIRILLGRRASGPSSRGRPLRGTPYDPEMIEDVFGVLLRSGVPVAKGVLFGGLGPAYETAAEVEMIRRLGAQVACMSTAVEVEEAARLGMRVAAVSLVTNLATGLSHGPLDHSEVIAAAKQSGQALAEALSKLLRGWSSDRPRA